MAKIPGYRPSPQAKAALDDAAVQRAAQPGTVSSSLNAMEMPDVIGTEQQAVDAARTLSGVNKKLRAARRRKS
jgi:ABC-type hemin transport system ATPase subunit